MCGQSPLYVPTTVNAILRNIDAVDCAATNVSCTNLTVKGEPISTAVQNMKGSTPGNTVFTGRVTADNMTVGGRLGVIDVDATDIVSETVTCDTITTRIANVKSLAVESLTASKPAVLGGVQCGGLTVTDSLSVTGATELKGPATFTANIIQSAGGAVLKNTNVASLTNAGTLTQTGAATFATNITQTAGTASFEATTVDSLNNTGALTQTGAATFAGNITQTAGTASLKAVTVASMTVSGTVTYTDLGITGNATFANGLISYKPITCNPSHITSASVPSGVPATGLLAKVTTGYNAYRIYWNGIGCTGNFTPAMYLGKVGAATGSTTYRATTQGNNTSTVGNRIVLNSGAAGLGNGELMTGQILIRKHPTITKFWMFSGFSQSNQGNGYTIYGHMTDTYAGDGWDSVSFEVSQGNLSNSAATCQIEPVLG